MHQVGPPPAVGIGQVPHGRVMRGGIEEQLAGGFPPPSGVGTDLGVARDGLGDELELGFHQDEGQHPGPSRGNERGFHGPEHPVAAY